MEQEAIVSRIWALGAEAGHRSHEGANAHSALVDWSWLYPQPPTEPPITFLCLSHTDLIVIFSSFFLPTMKASYSNAERVEPINNHLHGGENGF